MKPATIINSLSIAAALTSCTTLQNKDYPLVFMDKTNLGAGIEMNPATNTYTTSLGLRSRSFALVPVTMRNSDGSISPLQTESGESMSVYTEFGGKQNFLSSLLGIGTGGDKNEGGIGYQRAFATGEAAKTAAANRGGAATASAVAAIKDPSAQEATARALESNARTLENQSR